MRTEQINQDILAMKAAGGSAKGVSDGYHTFGELYDHRRVLTNILAHTYPEKAWKSWLHHDGTMFDDSFIIGFNTPAGQYSYHYHTRFWEDFAVKELEKAPEYDGHQPKDIDRLWGLMEKA